MPLIILAGGIMKYEQSGAARMSSMGDDCGEGSSLLRRRCEDTFNDFEGSRHNNAPLSGLYPPQGGSRLGALYKDQQNVSRKRESF